MTLLKLPLARVASLALYCIALSACAGGSIPAIPSSASASDTSSFVSRTVSDTSAVEANSVKRASASSVTPSFADAFVDSVGVDTHFNYGQSSYRSSYAAIRDALVASGIRHIRDGGYGYSNPFALAELGEAGIKHSASFPVNVTAAQITTTLEGLGYGPYVDFVEPQNEYDEASNGDPNWATEIVDEQHLLYSTIRSNPAFASVAVLGPSFGHPTDASVIGPLDAYEDAGNEHDYPCNDNPGTTLGAGIAPITALLRASTLTKPIWTTEVGYADNLTNWECAASDETIAKFDPRTIAERWLAGEPHTYFYQFADMAPDLNYDSMGLVTQTGKAKPQYTAIRSMLTLLSDRGTQPKLAPLTYGIAGDTSNLHQLLLQKRDGSYYLMLWLEVPGWNAKTSSEMRAPAQTVSLTLASLPTNAARYAYKSDWTLTEATLPKSKTLTIPVNDAITFVHLQF
jgi:hypothetical protein